MCSLKKGFLKQVDKIKTFMSWNDCPSCVRINRVHRNSKITITMFSEGFL